MRMKYISRIMTGLKKYKVVYTKCPSTRVLDGSYRSVLKGRSMNFDDLREYSEGDDIKDVDWKASARSRKLLVREYIAEKKHNFMFVFDADRSMLAETFAGEEKKETALMSGGTLAYLVNRNGDYIGSVHSSEDGIKHYPLKTGLGNIENMLNTYDRSVTMNNRDGLNKSLLFVSKNCRKRMIIVIIADMDGILGLSDELLRGLMAVNDIIAIHISDADIYGRKVYDIEAEEYLPDFVTDSKRLRKIQFKERQAALEQMRSKLKKHGISYVTISKTDNIGTGIVKLLEKHKLEKR